MSNFEEKMCHAAAIKLLSSMGSLQSVHFKENSSHSPRHLTDPPAEVTPPELTMTVARTPNMQKVDRISLAQCVI